MDSFIDLNMIPTQDEAARGEQEDGALYRISWVSLITGARGHGSYCLTLQQAVLECRRANSGYTSVLYHYPEAEK